MLKDQEAGKLQFQQRPTVTDWQKKQNAREDNCPLFSDFRKNGVGYLRPSFYLLGTIQLLKESETNKQMLRSESVSGRDEKKQLKETAV